MTGFVFVYITARSEDEATVIGRTLVEEKLAACVNILPGMRSVYRFEGKIEEAREAVLIVKTRADLFEKLEVRVKALHSYSCPCIVAFPVQKGSPEFLAWIDKSTR
jgi:periplasmic divalent cation tolerance protein